MIRTIFAPAKVNLYLHVGPPRADGFHPLSSLMVFADVGDRLAAEAAHRFQLRIEGPTAGHAPPGEDNLVLRAARALFARAGVGPPKLRLVLTKQLPAEAGLGGGSSDAAATLRLLRAELGLDLPDEALQEIAASLGSDIPACLVARPVIAEGRGERLSAAPVLPELPAVLVRPPVASSTAAVYRAFDALPAGAGAEAPALPKTIETVGQAVELMADRRNDLEAPAIALQPKIGEALARLRASPEARLARMSGSGSACFALCLDDAAATALADALQAEHPGWWVRACRLGQGASSG